MNPVPRQFNSAAELRSNAKAVRDYFKSLPAFVSPEPPPPPEPEPPTPEPETLAAEPVTCVEPPVEPSPPPDPLAFVWRPTLGARIRDMVAAHYGLTRAEIASANRTVIYLNPRYIGMYLCVRCAGMSSPAVGRLFGGRDHSTVISGVRKLKELMQADEKLAADVAEFVRQIEGWSAAETGGA